MNRAPGGRGRFGWWKDSGLPKRLSLIYLPDKRANRFSLLVFSSGKNGLSRKVIVFFTCVFYFFFTSAKEK